jgi:CMP-N,N'-diacetyllegionaminic acid synthase
LIRRQEQKKVYYARNGAAIYITKYPLIKKNILGKSLIPFEMNQLESLDINTLEDFKLANKLLK